MRFSTEKNITITTSETLKTEKGDFPPAIYGNTEILHIDTSNVSDESLKNTQSNKDFDSQSSSIKTETNKKPVNSNNKAETEMKYSYKIIEYIGRFSHNEGSSEFAWSGSKITAGFKGAKIGAVLKSNSSEDYLNIYIDGKKTKKLKISSKKDTYVLAENLLDERHTVELEKCTEGSQTTMTFYGFDYFDGTASFAPAKKDKTILFIGDSVTAGYGVLGTEKGFRLIEENIALTYAGYTTHHLNADGIYIAISGKGLAQNLDGSVYPVMKDYLQTTIPKRFENNPSSYDIKNENVDAVVINLGTNDFASHVDPEFFKTKYEEFITLLRGFYPKAHIVCMVGPHKVGYLAKSYIKQVAEKFSKTDKKVYFVSVSAVDGKGSDGHPSESEQIIAGYELVEFLSDIV